MRRLALLLALSSCIPLESEGIPKKNPDFLVVGHRGAPNLAAENTLPSYEAALAEGASAIEMDLCVTADGVVVVWHDPDPDAAIALARQSGLEGLLYVPYVPPSGSPLRRPIRELTLADFLASHGYAFREDPGVRDPAVEIPTFDAFLDWAAKQKQLEAVYLDIKVSPGEEDRAAQIVQAVIARNLDIGFYPMSIYPEIVARLISEDTAANVRVVWDHESAGALADSTELGLRDLSIGLTALRSETSVLGEIDDAVAARDQKRIDTITAWTLDSPMQMGVFLLHDVDAILTNEPARLYEIWQATLH